MHYHVSSLVGNHQKFFEGRLSFLMFVWSAELALQVFFDAFEAFYYNQYVITRTRVIRNGTIQILRVQYPVSYVL